MESFERQRQAFVLLKLLAQAERDYQTGRTLTRAEARRRFGRKLEELGERGR